MKAARTELSRPIYIVLRQSPDWAKQTYADLEKTREFCRIIGREETHVIDRVLLWDRTFTTSFFSARQFMKELTQETFRKVSGATVVTLADVKSVLDRRAFYLFTDDDDWYHPEIAQVLSKLDPRTCNAVLWRSAELGVLSGYDLQDTNAFYTNAYAVSGEVMLQRNDVLDRVTQHFEAQATFLRKTYGSVCRRIGYASYLRRLTVTGFQSIIRLPDSLSVTNKHPATVSAMLHLKSMSPEGLIDFITNRYHENKKIVVPEPFTWSRGMLNQVTDFLGGLLKALR
ncbi:MAG TPA: hypothetical protein VN604_09225 [Nitrospirota bacterium]|nr:hypothetical protein [Nitrospirota bacterium]